MCGQFTITCERCTHDIDFDLRDVPDLEKHVERKIDNAEGRMRRTVEQEFDGFVEADALVSGDRPLMELAAAIRRGDRAEAELQLDLIANEMGLQAIEQVQQGRYSIRARAA